MRAFTFALSLAVLATVFSASCTEDEPEPQGKTIVPPSDFPKYTWVSYSPTHFKPDAQEFPSDDDIKKDLRTLKGAGFTGIITYSSDGTLNHIPRLAHEAGFSACIMGIYYSNDTAVQVEITNAIAAKSYVDGYCVGNEGLHFGRYTTAGLEGVMDQIKNGTGRPITTSEPQSDYLGGPYTSWLLAHSEWLFSNAYPIFSQVYDPTAGVGWMQDQYRQLKEKADGKTVLFKETGWATTGDSSAYWATEENQRTYFKGLAATEVEFSYFEAFDQPWKTNEPNGMGPHWGLYDENRNPKLFIQGGLVL